MNYISEDKLKAILEARRDSFPGMVDLIKEIGDGYEDLESQAVQIADLQATIANHAAELEAAEKSGYDKGFLDRYFKPGSFDSSESGAPEPEEEVVEDVEVTEEADDTDLRALLDSANE